MSARINLIGRLTADAEFHEVSEKGGFLKFRIATSRAYTSKDGERKTDFFNVSKWLAKDSKLPGMLDKGKQVYIVGTLENDNFDGKDGQRVFRDTIKAQDIVMTMSWALMVSLKTLCPSFPSKLSFSRVPSM
jgi:single-strand DNA-binding protein